LHKICENEEPKKSEQRRSYEPDFKSEILKMLISGKKVSEISEKRRVKSGLIIHSDRNDMVFNFQIAVVSGSEFSNLYVTS
jgi:hypothetical protein